MPLGVLLAGFYINTGIFAKTCEEYAKRHRIALIDSAKLVLLVREAYASTGEPMQGSASCPVCGSLATLTIGDSPTRGNCPSGHDVVLDITHQEIRNAALDIARYCPTCGSLMIAFKGRRRDFWRCSNADCAGRYRL